MPVADIHAPHDARQPLTDRRVWRKQRAAGRGLEHGRGRRVVFDQLDGIEAGAVTSEERAASASEQLAHRAMGHDRTRYTYGEYRRPAPSRLTSPARYSSSKTRSAVETLHAIAIEHCREVRGCTKSNR